MSDVSEISVNEKPILFSAPMVRAILAGRKTQTRRVIKPHPPAGRTVGQCPYSPTGWAEWDDPAVQSPAGCHCGSPVRCRYDAKFLWVRESFMTGNDEVAYSATDQPLCGMEQWKPSIHMPRWASRITLEVKAIRVERVQDIRPEDSIAEGCCPAGGNEWDKPEVYRAAAEIVGGPYPRGVFASLWSTIHAADGPNGWNANPWVWVIEFDKI